MSSPATSDLAALREGWGALARRPATFAALVAAGTLLGAVGPLLQRLAALPSDPASSYLVGAAGMLPMELYFLPRLLLRLDAEEGSHPLNPAGAWKETFEKRWLRTVGAKLGLDLALVLGFVPFILPGFLILFAFGWAPMRVLLRGEALPAALRGSFALMRQSWRRAFLMVSAALSVTFLAAACLMALASLVAPSAAEGRDLTHPATWILNAASVAVNVWLSSTLLATYRRLEAYAPSPSEK